MICIGHIEIDNNIRIVCFMILSYDHHSRLGQNCCPCSVPDIFTDKFPKAPAADNKPDLLRKYG